MATLKRWTQSLAATDPVLRAQVAQQTALNRQLSLNADAVKLGITTQDAANAQLDRVRDKYAGYIQSAEDAAAGQTKFGQVVEFSRGQVAGFLGVLSVDRIVQWGAELFKSAAALKSQAEQAGVSVEALQAYRAALEGNGIEAGQTDQILTRLTHSIGDAQRQAGTARDDFNLLGISVSTLQGGAESTLPALAQALLKIEDPARRASLEVDLLGRSGQRLESALRTLIDPTSTLIEKEKALGQVLGDDVAAKADDASNRLTQAWNHIKDQVTPIVVDLTEALLDYSDAAAKAVGNGERTASGLPAAIEQAFPGYAQDVQQRAAAARGIANAKAIADANGASAFGFPVLGNGVVYGTGVHAGQSVSQAANDSTAYSDSALNDYIAKQKLSASIAGQGPIVQAELNAEIDAANIKLQSGTAVLYNQDGTLRKSVQSLSDIDQVLGASTAKELAGLAATIARGQQWNKVKETFNGYLASLNEEARVAGESNAQRQTELATIKAAQVAQAAALVPEKDRVKTYADAVNYLGQQKVQLVDIAATARQTAAFHKDITDQLMLANTAEANGRDDRELALTIAQKELDLDRRRGLGKAGV